MFLPARFVVVDDKEEHLQAIVDSLRASGTPCHAVRYNAAEDIDPILFKGVRALFMDLQLQTNFPSVDFATHYSVIQGILEDCISAEAGPFLMMLWTDQSEKSADLEAYLIKNLQASMPYCRPLAIIPLNKSEYITPEGKLKNRSAEGESLKDAILRKVNEVPSLASMMQWESEISFAAAEVLSDLVSVASSVGADETSPNSNNPKAMATALKLLARASAGSSQDSAQVRLSLHDALLPMLNDHIYNLDLLDEALATWERTFDDSLNPLPDLPPLTRAKLNKQVHFQIPLVSETSGASAWGAVSEVPATYEWSRVGMQDADAFKKLIVNSLKRSPEHPATFVQIRIGAACDYAQDKAGPISFVLACLFKSSDRPLEGLANSVSWISPMFEFEGSAHELVINPRMVYTTSSEEATSFSRKFRVREQLVMELISRIGFHAARPGIVRFD